MTIYATPHGTATPNPYAARIEELEAKGYNGFYPAEPIEEIE